MYRLRPHRGIAATNAENAHPNQAATETQALDKKKTQLKYILLRPDTYNGLIGSMTQDPFALDVAILWFEPWDMMCTPGLYKVIKEILVNATDNKQRDPDMDRLKVTVDAETNTISVLNNGKDITVGIHKEHDCYVQTLLFGHLLTGSNFNDVKNKITGGCNGYDAKPANISSMEFVVECLVVVWGLKFQQFFWDNMQVQGG